MAHVEKRRKQQRRKSHPMTEMNNDDISIIRDYDTMAAMRIIMARPQQKEKTPKKENSHHLSHQQLQLDPCYSNAACFQAFVPDTRRAKRGS